MYKNIKNLFLILRYSEIKNFTFLSIFILLNTFIELMSLGLLLPVVTSYLDNEVLSKIYNFLTSININSLKNYLVQNQENLLTILITVLLIVYTENIQ